MSSCPSAPPSPPGPPTQPRAPRSPRGGPGQDPPSPPVPPQRASHSAAAETLAPRGRFPTASGRAAGSPPQGAHGRRGDPGAADRDEAGSGGNRGWGDGGCRGAPARWGSGRPGGAAFPRPPVHPRLSAAPARRLAEPGSENNKKHGEISRTLVFLQQPLYELVLHVRNRRGEQRADGLHWLLLLSFSERKGVCIQKGSYFIEI